MRDLQVERADPRERAVTLRGNPGQIILPSLLTVQSLPGKAAPRWNSDGLPLTIGV
jgi:hypothetical protein